MKIILLLLCQGTDLWNPAPQIPPALLPVQEAGDEAKADVRYGPNVFVVYTTWDHDLRIEDGPGYGAEFAIEIGSTKSKWTGEIRIGAMAWDVDTDDSRTRAGDTDIRQIRVGAGTVFRVEELELGMGITTGQYDFRGPGDRDVSGFFEGQIRLGLQPIPGTLSAGLLGTLTVASTDFLRGSVHFTDNYGIGIYVAARF